MFNYNSLSATVIGESHIRKQIACQDHSDNADNKNIQIAVVSDGHGDSACFRSHMGSRFAVQSCIEGLKELAEEITQKNITPADFENEKTSSAIKEQLAKGILAKWNLLIQNDLNENPVGDEIDKIRLDENNTIDEKTLQNYQNGVKQNHIYGATLIGILIADDMLIALHQGDGKCVMLDKKGSFSEPIKWDDRCVLNITTSLCDDDALQSFRFYTQELTDENRPAAIFAASDGVEDSYGSSDAMHCFYRSLCVSCTENGIESTVEQLKSSILPQMTREGSADDISVAGIMDIESIIPLIPDMQAKNSICILDENIRDAEERKKSMEAKKEYYERKFITADNALSNAMYEYEKTEKESQKLQNIIGENNKKIENCNAKIEEYQNHLTKIKEDWDVIKNNFVKYNLEKPKYEKESKSIQKEIRGLRKKIVKLEDANGELDEQCIALTGKLNKLNLRYLDLKAEKENITSEKNEYLKQYNELEKTIKELTDQKTSLLNTQ